MAGRASSIGSPRRGGTLSKREPLSRDGLLRAPDERGCPLPTLLPGRDTGEQTSCSAMIMLQINATNKLYHYRPHEAICCLFGSK